MHLARFNASFWHQYALSEHYISVIVSPPRAMQFQMHWEHRRLNAPWWKRSLVISRFRLCITQRYRLNYPNPYFKYAQKYVHCVHNLLAIILAIFYQCLKHQGPKFWSYTNKTKDEGYPKNISVEFPKIPDNIDAAFVWSGSDKIYFMKVNITHIFEQNILYWN